MFTAEEWAQTFGERVSSQAYLEWHEECRALGERFGIAGWVVARLCLQKRYRPEQEPYAIEAKVPRVRVISECSDPLFLEWLAYEAQRLGLFVVQRQGSFESTCIIPGYLEAPATPLPPSKPPLHSAFQIRVETPIGYPPEAARQLQKEAERLARELLRRLGYRVPERLRTSSLVSQGDRLQVGEEQLPSGALYDIVENLYPDGDLAKDQERRNLIKSRRHKLRERLIKPYDDKP